MLRVEVPIEGQTTETETNQQLRGNEDSAAAEITTQSTETAAFAQLQVKEQVGGATKSGDTGEVAQKTDVNDGDSTKFNELITQLKAKITDQLSTQKDHNAYGIINKLDNFNLGVLKEIGDNTTVLQLEEAAKN